MLMKAIKDIILKEKLCLQLARGTNIFYVYVRRGSRTWNSCSLCFFQQEQEFLLKFLRKKKGSGTGIPVEFLSVARTPKGQVRPTES